MKARMNAFEMCFILRRPCEVGYDYVNGKMTDVKRCPLHKHKGIVIEYLKGSKDG